MTLGNAKIPVICIAGLGLFFTVYTASVIPLIFTAIAVGLCLAVLATIQQIKSNEKPTEASRVLTNQQIKSNENPAEASRVLMAVGIVIAIIGVGLILISPSFIFHDKVPGEFFGTTIMYDRTRNLTGAVKFFGIFLLVIGGIISAIGFSKSISTQPTPPQSEAPETKKTCPECAESIKDAARTCRFCGHKFS